VTAERSKLARMYAGYIKSYNRGK